MGRLWGRLYLGTRNHRKIKTLRRRYPQSWKTFYVLLEMALEVDDNGFIYLEPGQPYPLEELADEVDETQESLRSLLQTMEDLGMILVNDHGIQFLSYAERQFKSDSDGAERVRRHRQTKAAGSTVTLRVSKESASCNEDVTLQSSFGNGGVTAPDTETDTETEICTLPSGSVVGRMADAAPPADNEVNYDWNQKEEFKTDLESSNGVGVDTKSEKFGPVELVVLWNEIGCQPRVLKLTDDRRKKAGLRQRERGDPDWWRCLFEKVRDLADRPWLTFDFLIRNETNALKVLEGAYDKDFPQQRKQNAITNNPSTSEKYAQAFRDKIRKT